ncbi:LOW QUALITY PROTEIN: aldehyde oxidase 4 [Jatropha curcas]|uniref:LOW QUALITY PROTEIN: aldehyde oxidase 4 n=1 Tax=Jatropha curcas TaxID=180498 RepID=UPI001896097F|nr:LOW QUALITY PROTEIN: aldehyde oxidase 4 [Jatropha curcas]
MEEERETGNKNSLVFAVNGKRFELSSVDPSTTLLEFLRTQTSFKSVKLGCGEGGCGACVVLLSKYNPVLDQVEDLTVSSCLTLLCSINGASITTSEGLGNSKDGFHSIHQRFSGFHASQCGFCTPGMCMSLFGALVKAEKTDRPEPSPGFSKLTVNEAEKAIAGNLCRCTGYRPIADACKSFAADVDMEDLGLNSFWKKGEPQEVKIGSMPPYNQEICTFPEFLKTEVKFPLLLDSKRCSWQEDALAVNLIIWRKLANKFVRNTGSIGGNLVNGQQRKSFPSDIATYFLQLVPYVHVISGTVHEKLTLEEFLEKNGHDDISMSEEIKLKENHDKLDHVKSPSLLLSSKQVIQLNKQYDPVGKPIAKTGAFLQASGEAVYVDDIPSPRNCLHGAFIYSTKPFAKVKSIKFNSESLPDGVTAVLPDGVTAVISFKDIPKGGQNIGSLFAFGPEPLFAEELTQYAGEPLAFVLADTQRNADIASKLAVVDYDLENLQPPILTVEEAIERSSIFEVPPIIYPKQIGDVSKGMAEADNKILSAEAPIRFFYSNQAPEIIAHTVIAKCLRFPEHNVRVLTEEGWRRFGGKALKAMPVATACALAAHKLQRPVRVYLNRHTDMIMVGGRHPMKITYSVGFKSNGKITALKLDILINAGISIDVSPVMPKAIVSALKKYDWGALSFDIKVCKTNVVSKSAMRAPGDVQGSYIAEAIIENVAAFLFISSDSVRAINLHTYNTLKLYYDLSAGEPLEYTLTSIWNKLATSSSFEQRTELIKEFNRSNVWKKRGISRIPVVYEVGTRPTAGKVSILNDGSIVVEVGGLEIGQGLWTKVKQMVAFALSSIKCDGAGDLLDKVRVIQSDTLSLTQGGMTAGSTTSESSCEAVRLCCNVLVERLMAVKERLLAQMDSIKWEKLISQAYLEAVHLSANSYFVPESASMEYLNYGAAASEVEVDLLTGHTTILRSDILYDCGQSLNPAVDLGQIEGAFVQGIGFFMLEEHTTNSDGLVDAKGTWTYKIPTIDTIPKQFNVEIINSGHHQNRVLSSKASGEPPLLLAASVHCATRAAISEARKQLDSWGCLDSSRSTFQVDVPATMPTVKELCGLDIVERYLQWKMEGN